MNVAKNCKVIFGTSVMMHCIARDAFNKAAISREIVSPKIHPKLKETTYVHNSALGHQFLN